eukprot:261958-Amorphochlora_amoeboformis.AAC.1
MEGGLRFGGGGRGVLVVESSSLSSLERTASRSWEVKVFIWSKSDDPSPSAYANISCYGKFWMLLEIGARAKVSL